MTQYAKYNSTVSDPKPVTGWYDTDALPYPSLPASTNLLEVTSEQFAARLTNPDGWAVSGGVLVSYTPPTPAPTLAQQAGALLGGTLTITSTATGALDGAYAVDDSTQSHINSEMLCVQVTGKFADGSTSVAWPDASGSLHTFTVAQFQTFALAVAAFVAGCFKVISGTSTTLPATTANIA